MSGNNLFSDASHPRRPGCRRSRDEI